MPEDDQVEPQDDGRRNSPKVATGGGDPTPTSAEARECYWNDKRYSDGATVCDAGQRYKCWSGRWVDIGNC